MRHTNTLRTLAIGSALILATSTTACTSEEDTSDTSELPNIEASPPDEASQEVPDEKSPATVENFSPRVFEAFGLDWPVIHELNPRSLFVRMPAFGLTNPVAHLKENL